MYFRGRQSVKEYFAKLMKLSLAVLLGLALCSCGGTSKQESAVSNAGTIGDSMIRKNVPIYYYNLGNRYYVNLFFEQNAEDLPYITIDDAVMLLSDFTRLSYHLDKEKDSVTITRNDNEYYSTIDFGKGTINFVDYNQFFRAEPSTTLLDIDSNLANSELFYSDDSTVFNICGKEIDIDLNRYNIPYKIANNSYFLPLHTFVDIYLAPMNIIVNYNTEAVFAGRVGNYSDATGQFSEFAMEYYSVQPESRSEALIEYNYNELCLCLDINYGLKKVHNISDFDTLFVNSGYIYDMKDADPECEGLTLEALTNAIFGDSHSRYLYPNCYLGSSYNTNSGFALSKSLADHSSNQKYYREARSKAFMKPTPFYEEYDNTAYVTLDDFVIDFEKDYFAAKPTENASDTIEKISYAHSQITRNNSPIENVVLDLSNNSGGQIEAALYTLAWCMKEAPMFLTDSFTDAESTATYKADVNLDHKFDEKDVLDDVNIYCLISPVSFSCGNMVPAVLKATGRVTILGAPSGGGTSIVSYVSTADGNVLQLSSSKIISLLKNGSFYDVDKGVEPDYKIDKAENMYKRDELTKYINSLY